MTDEQFLRDLKCSSEYEDVMLSIGQLETYKEIEEKIIALCGYAWSIGESQGYSQGFRDCREGRELPRY